MSLESDDKQEVYTHLNIMLHHAISIVYIIIYHVILSLFVIVENTDYLRCNAYHPFGNILLEYIDDFFSKIDVL